MNFTSCTCHGLLIIDHNCIAIYGYPIYNIIFNCIDLHSYQEHINKALSYDQQLAITIATQLAICMQYIQLHSQLYIRKFIAGHAPACMAQSMHMVMKCPLFPQSTLQLALHAWSMPFSERALILTDYLVHACSQLASQQSNCMCSQL